MKKFILIIFSLISVISVNAQKEVIHPDGSGYCELKFTNMNSKNIIYNELDTCGDEVYFVEKVTITYNDNYFKNRNNVQNLTLIHVDEDSSLSDIFIDLRCVTTTKNIKLQNITLNGWVTLKVGTRCLISRQYFNDAHYDEIVIDPENKEIVSGFDDPDEEVKSGISTSIDYISSSSADDVAYDINGNPVDLSSFKGLVLVKKNGKYIKILK